MQSTRSTVLAFALFLASFSTKAATLCESETFWGVNVGWCVSKDPASRNPDFLYVLHGGGGNEHAWEGSGTKRALELVWKKSGADQPTVIAFSFGPQWLLGDFATQQHPAYLPLVVNQVIPVLEKKLGGLRGRRFLMGHSMGGYNGAELSLRFPNLFFRVALLCPGISTVNPFASAKELEDYLAKQPATTNRSYVIGVAKWVQSEFKNPAIWGRHDPLRLSTLTPRSGTSYLLSCTKDDEFGFFEGAEIFARNLNSRGIKAEWIPVEKGGHCAMTPSAWERLAQFLVGK